VVFLAEQREPVRRQVALKVVKPGMDTRSVIAQFESERQALAMMDHPHIARVFDAGATEAGRPYFVMELVRGVKITDYCDQHSLTTRARLELFIQVCHAIQHAHQKGIIHRDIKPSNILVATTGEDTPLPKVIDFGIAKATTGLQLTDKTFYTAFEMLIGTPAYMSPEQAAVASTDLDTRTDIYSLGVLLYELMAGEPPFDLRELFKLGLDEVRRGILTNQPVRPSVRLKGMADAELTEVAQRRQTDPARLIRSIRGDLDWIVMKAVEKDRARRYPTANALAMDVQHFLADEPVLARPPGTLYQLRKLVARNRLLVGSLSAFALLLLAGLAVTSVLLARERTARGQAEIEKQTARVEAAKSSQVSEFLGRMLSSVSPSVAMGRDTTILRELLARTDQEIGTELKNQPEVEVALRLLLEQSYLEIGDIPAAERMLRRALQIYQTGPSPDRRQGAAVMTALGDLLIRENHYQEAESLLMSARDLWDELDAKEEKGSVNTMETIAILRSRQGRDDEAETLMRRVYAWRQKNLSPGDPDLNNALANLAVIVFAEKKYSEAEGMFRRVLEALQRLHGDAHPKLVTALRNLSRTISEQGRDEEAREYLSRAVAVYRKCYQAAHPDRLRETLELAEMDRGARAFSEAEPLYREVIENGGGTPDANPAQLRAAVGGLAITLQELNRTGEAIALFDKRLTAEALASPQCVPWLEMRAEFLARGLGGCHQAGEDGTRGVRILSSLGAAVGGGRR
jgi:serine/threonine protein kinase